jgi:hypothetical protein
MGKRSNYQRREADFYPTPRAAVVPYPHGIRSFAEPCANGSSIGFKGLTADELKQKKGKT